MVKIQSLKQRLGKIEEITNNPKWTNDLAVRKKKEMEFYDLNRDKSRIESIDKDSHKKFYGNKKY